MSSPHSLAGQTLTALCSALPLDAGAGSAPDWIHLIPTGEVRTRDGRGPYRVTDIPALMAASLTTGGKLVLDENHATDLAAPRGEEAPARGWIVELQSRQDGIWGRVEWTNAGRQKIIDQEYRGVSPVIAHRKDGAIVAILRASLVNQPNFLGLTALHQEDVNMNFREMLLEALGLGSDADDAAIMAALKAKLEGSSEAAAVAVQSALSPIATLIGLQAGVDAAAVLAGVEQLKAGGKDDARVTALQSELSAVTVSLNALTEQGKKDKATAFVDGAIADLRVGIKPLRADYIAMHMENPERTEKQINAMPKLQPGATLTTTIETGPDASDDPLQIAAHATAYQKKQADAGITIDFAAAVMAVQEGRNK
tara:strand:+ start:7582 stop:8685 length:1104 start_codon:yes stop_codon:yes gene_type:complete